MSDERVVVREVAWQDVFPAVSLLGTLRLAVSFRALLLSAVALVATVAGWNAFRLIFPGIEVPYVAWPWEVAQSGFAGAYLADMPSGPGDVTPFPAPSDSPLAHAWEFMSNPVQQIFRPDVDLPRLAYWLLCAFWTLAVWAFFGGAITRQMTVALARGEKLPLRNMLGFAGQKWISFLGAPLFPLVGALLTTLPLVLFGLLLRFDAGVLIAGILWPLVLLAGAFMALLLLGLLFGWPLMWATISAEGTDAFGALSSSYAYVSQRPLLYLIYAIIAAVISIVGWFLVSLVAMSVVSLGIWAASWGSGNDYMKEAVSAPLNTLVGLRWAGAALIRFWIGCVYTLAAAFAFSYLWAVASAIYFLLRRNVDGTEMDEVFLPEEEEAFGLPPLETDATGEAAGAQSNTAANTEG